MKEYLDRKQRNYLFEMNKQAASIKKYYCYDCKGVFDLVDMEIGRYGLYSPLQCKFCFYKGILESNAKQQLIIQYNMRCDEYPEDLFEIEVLRCKIRWVMSGKESRWITAKNENYMITQVTNSTEMRQALNENLHALLTRKRKLLVAREVNNTLGKIMNDVKIELMHNAMTGNNNSISWFDKPSIALPASNHKHRKLKTA